MTKYLTVSHGNQGTAAIRGKSRRTFSGRWGVLGLCILVMVLAGFEPIAAEPWTEQRHPTAVVRSEPRTVNSAPVTLDRPRVVGGQGLGPQIRSLATLWETGISTFPRQGHDDEADDQGFRLQPTDHLTLIGGSLVERLQLDSRWEVALYQYFAERQPGGSSLQIRNLGWSGDDVWGTARAVFGQPSDGFARLKSDLALTQPSVALIAYGANESFDGPAGLERFDAGLRSVIEMARQTGARPILVTPPPFEDLGPPLPSMTVANENLTQYCGVIRQIAQTLKLPLIDLHQQIQERPALSSPRTENGIHLSDAGREEVSRLLVDGLLGSKISEAQWASAGAAEEIAAMVRQKNEWFFHRYRPQNETYLFLFRKHEQGNNASEIPQFDVLIQGLESVLQRTATAPKPNG